MNNIFSSLKFKDKGVNIIAVGIGRGIKEEELKLIAGDRGSTVQVSDFNALASKLEDILAEVCSKCCFVSMTDCSFKSQCINLFIRWLIIGWLVD